MLKDAAIRISRMFVIQNKIYKKDSFQVSLSKHYLKVIYSAICRFESIILVQTRNTANVI